MTGYFILNSNWRVFYGMKELSILNYKTGEVIVLNKENFDIFSRWNRGQKIEKPDVDSMEEKLLDLLIDSNVGTIQKKFYIVQDTYNEKLKKLDSEKNTQIVRAFVQLPGICTRNCFYCGEKISSPCFHCQKVKIKQSYTIEDYKKLLETLKKANCQQVWFYGENIFQYEGLPELVKSAAIYNMEIYLVFNENNFDAAIAKNFINTKTNYIFSCYIENENMVDSLIIRSKEIIKNQKIYPLISVLYSDMAIKSYKKYSDKLEQAGLIIMNSSCFVHGEISKDELETVYHFDEYNMETLTMMRHYNMCLTNTININTKFEVSPCPHLQQYILGTFHKDKEGINFIANKQNILSDFWFFTKNKVEQCSDCSKRYMCAECRAVEVFFTKSQWGKRSCPYFREYNYGN